MSRRRVSPRTCSFQIMQGDLMVAEVSGADEEAVRRDVWHYVSLYAQDGAVTITSKSGHNPMPAFLHYPSIAVPASETSWTILVSPMSLTVEPPRMCSGRRAK